MKLYIFLLIFAVHFTSTAEVTISNEGDGLYLQGDSLDEVTLELENLRLWSGSQSKRECQSQNIKKISDQLFKIEIFNCIHDHAKQLINKTPKNDGPNCFNLVLNYKKANQGYFEADITEIEAYLTSPLCNPLGRLQEIQPGDIGLIWDGVGYIHTFIYGSKNIVYTKNGVSIDNPYQISTLNELNDLYHVGIYSRENMDSECFQSTEPECQQKIQLSNFRCQNFESIVQLQNSEFTKKVYGWIGKLFELEKSLNESVFAPLTETERRKIILQNKNLADKILAELLKSNSIKSDEKNQMDQFLKKIILSKANNFSYIFSRPPLSDNESDWFYKLHSKLLNYLN